jgi:hypothetical protein
MQPRLGRESYACHHLYSYRGVVSHNTGVHKRWALA